MTEKYHLYKNKKTKKISIDYKNISGFNFKPKNSIKYDGILVNKMILINPKLIEKILKRKIKRRLDIYLKLILKFIDSDSSDDGSSIREALNDLTRYESIIKHKYKKYLDEKYLKILLKKIAVLEYELNLKLINLTNIYTNSLEYEEEYESHRRR